MLSEKIIYRKTSLTCLISHVEFIQKRWYEDKKETIRDLETMKEENRQIGSFHNTGLNGYLIVNLINLYD